MTVTLPAGTTNLEAARVADTLRDRSRTVTEGHAARATVSVSSPHAFTAAGQDGPAALAPRRAPQSGTSLRPRRGIVSPNSPARRDVQAARLQRRLATAVSATSPASPSAAPDSLVIDLFGRRARIDGVDVEFTHKEFELLAHLAENARRVVSREELMEHVWQDVTGTTGERTVDVHVRRVRTKLGRYRRLVSTVRGAGYRLDPGSDVEILR